jgi:hypothetical protein
VYCNPNVLSIVLEEFRLEKAEKERNMSDPHSFSNAGAFSIESGKDEQSSEDRFVF